MQTGFTQYKSEWVDSIEEAIKSYWAVKLNYYEVVLRPIYTGYIPERILESVHNWCLKMCEIELKKFGN